MGIKSTNLLRGIAFFVISFLIIVSAHSQTGGRALYLSNENYLTHGDFVYFGSPDYSFSDKLTVACWVKWTTNPQTYTNVHNENEGMWANIITIDKHNAKDNGQFWLQHSSGNNKFEWAVQASSRQYIQSSTMPQQDVWYYIVGVYDGSSSGKKMILYINGIEEASLSGGISGNIAVHSALDRLNIGRLPNGYRLFPGCIDEVRIWKRILDVDEIRKQMFNKSTINSTNLASYWSMDQPSGTTIFDEAPIPTATGKFYTALVDVHSFTPSPFTVTDADKNWEVNSWNNCPIKTVAGDGVDEANIITSNTSTVLTFQNATITTPKLDDLGNGTGMTWYGIQKDGEASQWILSTATVGEACKLVKTQDSTAVGWPGASISVKISSSPDNDNNLSMYFWGAVDLLPVTGESYPSGITRRSNMVWGVREWGSVTSSVFISYPNIANNFNPATSILLGRTSGSSIWTQVPAVADTVNRWFYADNVNSFNEYSIGMTEQTMPVRLESFTHSVNSNNVKLCWITSEEINNSGFDVERSDNNGVSYSKISFVKGNGNSPGNHYSYTDFGLKTGVYKYRLKQIDYNSNYEYYPLSSSVDVSCPGKFNLKQNYPNPSNPTSKIDFEIPVNAFVSVQVYDVTGRIVSRLVNEKLNAGYYSTTFNGSNLASGIYYYKIFVKSEKEQFNGTKKLVLIK